MQAKIIEQPFEEEVDDVSMQCQRCHDYLCFATQTFCNHIFCRECIDEYLLYLDQCPICKLPLRQLPLYRNLSLDAIISDYLQVEPKQFQDFSARLKKYKHSRSADRFGKIRTGMVLDVRDLDYVWRTATIDKIIRYGFVQQRWSFQVNYGPGIIETIQFSSGRLAPLGTFTSRKQIPHYSRSSIVMQKNGIAYEFSSWKKNPLEIRNKFNQNL